MTSEVSSISPDICGSFGGCAFTIAGSGLSSSYDINIAGTDCVMRDSSTDTELICDVPSFTSTVVIANDGVHSSKYNLCSSFSR